MPRSPITRRALLTAPLILLASGRRHERVRTAAQDDGRPRRIISLIPAVTEMLFALGAGPDVVAVSSFDEYPPEVRALPRVGALIDPDVERILALKPQLVIVYATQTDLIRQLARAGIPTFLYQHAGLPDVGSTIRELGERVGRRERAESVTRRIDDGLAALAERVAGRPRPRTLVVFGREPLALRGIFASGGTGFLHDMLVAAGGENVFGDLSRQSVQATSEVILARRPEVILELRAGGIAAGHRDREVAVWKALPALPAVAGGRVYLIADPRTVVPGPRVAEGAELIARALHPQAFR
ncbi:MAG TPA: helical backbone metal receptor [Vicinamibacterales bacterium]|nr:helical backbone metal receptor [Vicinamibacterales bacterium]